jgi:hypothetical protein
MSDDTHFMLLWQLDFFRNIWISFNRLEYKLKK